MRISKEITDIDLTCPHCFEPNPRESTSYFKYYYEGEEDKLWGNINCYYCNAQLESRISAEGKVYLKLTKAPPKVSELLLQFFDAEDKWVQQASCMVNKNDTELLSEYNKLVIELNVPPNGLLWSKSIIGYDVNNSPIYDKKRQAKEKRYYELKEALFDPNKATCWCLSGALEKLTRSGKIKSYSFALQFQNKYGYIDKFNDSHTFKEVLEAIKSIDA